jgi:hypothetical protein
METISGNMFMLLHQNHENYIREHGHGKEACYSKRNVETISENMVAEKRSVNIKEKCNIFRKHGCGQDTCYSGLLLKKNLIISGNMAMEKRSVTYYCRNMETVLGHMVMDCKILEKIKFLKNSSWWSKDSDYVHIEFTANPLDKVHIRKSAIWNINVESCRKNMK